MDQIFIFIFVVAVVALIAITCGVIGKETPKTTSDEPFDSRSPVGITACSLAATDPTYAGVAAVAIAQSAPCGSPKPVLSEMLEGVTDDNLHPELLCDNYVEERTAPCDVETYVTIPETPAAPSASVEDYGVTLGQPKEPVIYEPSYEQEDEEDEYCDEQY